MGRLQGKIALITGAAQGIGLGTAELFEKEGATVILSDVNDALGESVKTQFLSATYLHLDVRSERDWTEAKSYIEQQFGGLDILVNNAGVTGFQENWGPQDPENASLESWHQVHSVNQDGTFLGCKYGIALMKKRVGVLSIYPLALD
jgi:3(or 17)beta-hydroxysteroid dehydrogenase